MRMGMQTRYWSPEMEHMSSGSRADGQNNLLLLQTHVCCCPSSRPLSCAISTRKPEGP